MNNKKIKIIRYWLQSTNIKEIQGFLKFVNFYRYFIKRFGRLIILLIKLIKNDKVFEWTKKQQDVFDQIKYKIINKLILAMIDSNKSFEIETDTSDFVFGGQFV